MGTPSFVPIIGKDFGDIANQQYQWAGFSQRQDEANLARATAAQNQRNDWLARLADLQRHDAARGDQYAQMAQDRAQAEQDQRAHDLESARRFDIGTNLSKEQLAIERARYQGVNTEKDKAQEQQLNTIENTAKFMSSDVHDLGTKAEEARNKFSQVMDAANQKRVQLEKDLPRDKISFDTKLGEFQPAKGIAGLPAYDPSKEPALEAKRQQANAELAKMNAQYDAALASYQLHNGNFEAFKKQALSSGLQVGKRDNKFVVYSPFHDKQYSAPDAGTSGAPSSIIPPSTGTATGAAPIANPWSGIPPGPDLYPATGSTGGPAAAAGPSGAPVRIGRFTVYGQ